MSTQESKDARLHISSILDTETETRIIRSHRRPPNKVARQRTRLATAVLALSLVAGSVSAVNGRSSAESVPAVAAPSATQIEVQAPRQTLGAVATRSLRAAPTRKQKIEKVIRYAMAQRGDRYRWGAAGPNRWDCSGLVSVAFKKGAGISLPHYTGGMLKRGKHISRKNLQRGDIIFPQRGHVAIYLGGGKMIAASSGKGKVIVQKVYGFYAARRVL